MKRHVLTHSDIKLFCCGRESLRCTAL